MVSYKTGEPVLLGCLQADVHMLMVEPSTVDVGLELSPPAAGSCLSPRML